MNQSVNQSPVLASQKSEGLFLGIDAGGTKTVALLVDRTGRVLGAGRAAACNIYGDVNASLGELDLAVSEALKSTGSSPDRLAATCLSATGADWSEDFALLEQSLKDRGYGRLHVVNDAMGALRAGSPDGTGVVVVCGTAAGIGAKSQAGNQWHSSFWQEPEGAQQLGRAALRAVYRAELELDPATSLRAALLEHHGFKTVETMLHAHTARDRRDAQDVGRLARVLLNEAECGDATARRIVLEHGMSLGDYAIVAARKVGLLTTSFPVVTAGGVMRHASPLISDALLARVREVSPDAYLIRSPLEPVAGAAMLALELAGVTIGDELIFQLRQGFPKAALFQT